jgi:ferric-dicitrate binding protein FerR (iron transport regulator)
MTRDPYDPHAAADEQGDTLARLIRAAGRRAEPPTQAYEQTLAAAMASWDQVQSRRRRRVLATLAASIALAIGVAFLLLTQLPQGTPPIAGRTDRIVGTVEMRGDSQSAWSTLRDDLLSLPLGAGIRTRDGSRAGILLSNGISLRLAEATEVVLESEARLRVIAGKVYVDTGAMRPKTGIEVVTNAGTAVDVGTQFEVLYRDGEYRLRVREGRVLLRHDAGEVDGQAGEQLKILPGGELERTRIEHNDSGWDWVESLAPAPDIDRQPVTVLLTWVARETGRTVRFASPDIERKAGTTILHGNISHLAPLEALSVMLATTDLDYTLPDDATILVRLKDSQ